MTERLARALVLVLAIALAACAGGGVVATPASEVPSPAPSASGAVGNKGPTELTVLAAASLKGVMEQAAKDYEAATGVTLTVSTDSSTALATQIKEGAPADVFLSADTKNPVDLADNGFASGAPVDFAGNALTVIVPSDNPAGLTGPLDLAKDGVKVIAAGDDVPISKYARQLIDNLSKEPGAPADFAARVAANTVSKEDNVKAVVAKVELGEGDAAIVYVTDAAASEVVRSIDVPADANVPAIYAGIVVKASPNQEAASAFLDWFVGPDGQAILASFGFLPPPAS